MDDIMKTLTQKAKRYGASEFGISKTINERFYVLYENNSKQDKHTLIITINKKEPPGERGIVKY